MYFVELFYYLIIKKGLILPLFGKVNGKGVPVQVNFILYYLLILIRELLLLVLFLLL